MTLVKCPRCELNYMNEGERMCSVCRKELHGESDQYEVIELCSECGENPVVPGQELCAYCLKELARRSAEPSDEGVVPPAAVDLDGIDSVSSMDEIELDLGDDLPDEDFDDDGFEEDLDEEDLDEEDLDEEDADEDGDA